MWCMVPEIWSMTERIFCDFGPFFALLPPSQPGKSKFWKNEKKSWRYYHFTHVYHKWQSHDIWFLRYEAWQTEFFVILDRFLSFYPSNNTKNQNFEKLKKNTSRYHHFTQVYQKSWSYAIPFLRYGAYFLFWAIFCHFTSQTAWKIKIKKKKKKKKRLGDIIILQ